MSDAGKGSDVEDMLRELARLRHYATNMQQLFADLQRAAPERSEGTDQSGAIQAVVGQDGVPEAFRVSTWWHQRLTSESFGAAVTEACEEAAKNRGAFWTQQLRESGWQQSLDRLEADSAAAAAADPGPVHPADTGQPRPLGIVAEEVIASLDRAAQRAATPLPQPTAVSGANRQGTLTVTLSPDGQASCQADPHWASQRSGAQLTEALNTVLAIARKNLSASSASAERTSS